MKNNKLLGILLWFIGVAIDCLLLFCLAKSYSTAVWVTFGFTIFVFVSQLALWIYTWHVSSSSAEEGFFHLPVIIVSARYMFLQIIPCVVFAFWQAPAQVAVLANMALSIVMWIFLILALLTKNYISQIDKRQKKHHKEL